MKHTELRFISLVLAVLLMSFTVAFSQSKYFKKTSESSGEQELHPVSRAFWGSSKANFADNKYVYLAAGGAILILRTTSAESLTVLNYFYLPSEVEDIVVRDNILFATDFLSGFHVFDISDIFNPSEIGTLQLDHKSYRILLDSDAVFISHNLDGISKIDISQINNPTLTDIAPFPCTKAKKKYGYLYCIGDEYVTIANAGTLDSLGFLPVEQQSPFGDNINDVIFSDSGAILIENHYGDVPPNLAWSFLTLLDMSNPLSPLRMSAMVLRDDQHAATYKGGILFSLSRDTLSIVDVSPVNRPTLLSKTPNFSGDFISVADTLLYASFDYAGGLQVINIQNISSPKKGVYLQTLSDIGSVYATDTVLIAGRFDNSGISLVDLHNISKPQLKYWYTTGTGSVRGIAYKDGYVFAATGQGLKIFTLNSSDSLSLISELSYGSWAMRVDASESLVVTGGGYYGVHLINVKDIGAPKYITYFPMPAFMYVEDVFLKDTLLFVGGDYGGFRIYSISNPAAPLLLWKQYLSDCEAIYPRENNLFVADYSTLRNFDITNPNQPTETGSISLNGRITDIYVRDTLAFASVCCAGFEGTGMRVINVGSVANMREIAFANTSGWPNAIYANNKAVFLSVDLDGVYVYNLNDIVTGIRDNLFVDPLQSYTLSQNYPNPFNPETRIRYAVSRRQYVSIKIYDVLGREVSTLVDEMQDAGSWSVMWDAKGVGSGVYFYKLQAGSFVETKKMVVVR